MTQKQTLRSLDAITQTVEFDPAVRFGLLTYCEIENTLSDRLAVKVDLVMKKVLKPKIGERILQEVVYL